MTTETSRELPPPCEVCNEPSTVAMFRAKKLNDTALFDHVRYFCRTHADEFEMSCSTLPALSIADTVKLGDPVNDSLAPCPTEATNA